MGFDDFVALAGLFLSVCMFITLAFQRHARRLTLEGLLLGGRNAHAREFGASFAAASTSLATVLIFFIGTSMHFGVFLLWCGATYLSGQALFIKLMERVHVNTQDLTTNADFVLQRTGGIRTSRTIAALTVSAFLLILFLELYIGSEIVSYYLTGLGAAGKGVAFAVVGFVVVFYVRVGGLRVVFRTDVWQFYLMVAACLALLLFAASAQSAPSSDLPATHPPFFANATATQLALFMGWILVLNLTLPFTQLSSWQRLAATRSVDEAWTGLKERLPGFLAIWMVPVVALVILNAKGFVPTTLSELFDVLRAQGGDATALLYPLVFVGFASALFSTADTAMIALQFALADKSTLGPRLTAMDEPQLRRTLLLTVGAIVLGLALLYSLAEAELGAWFFPLVYAIFSQLTIIAPHVLYSLLEASGRFPNRGFSAVSDRRSVAGLCVAWLVLIGATIGRATGHLPQLGTQEAATGVALAISTLGLLFALRKAEIKSPSAPETS